MIMEGVTSRRLIITIFYFFNLIFAHLQKIKNQFSSCFIDYQSNYEIKNYESVLKIIISSGLCTSKFYPIGSLLVKFNFMNIIIRSGRKKESSCQVRIMINIKYLLLFSCSLHPINILKHFNFIAFTFSDLANANQKLLWHTLLIMYINF